MTETQEQTAQGARTRLVSGPGILLVWLYGVMSVGAVSRSIYQIATEFDRAPLAYGLSAVAAVVYACLLYTSPSPRDISGSRMPSSA